MNTILGLDLGTTSIGWCLLDTNPKPQSIIAVGVRIFPEGVDRTKGEKSLNQERREARSLRRQGYRRVRRKQKLLHALQDAGLLPGQQVELDALMKLNPYALRARALDEPLECQQLGRALYHLGQRRGYRSNRKTGNDKEDRAVLQGIGKIDTAMHSGNYRTLGEYFNAIDPHSLRIRGNYTARRMYEKEFDHIWEAQEKYHPKALGVANRRRIRAAIFDQRPLKIQKHLVGYCDFEPERKRAASATLAAQEFRLWQNLNHLKVIFADGTERFLTDEERLTLHARLSTSKSMAWGAVKKALEFPDKSSHFNMERVRKSGLLGNQSAALLITALGKRTWQALNPRQQEALVFDLINIADESALKNRLRKYWRFDEACIEKLLKPSLPKGYMHLSHKAIRTLLPFLSEVPTMDNRGATYSLACERAGYQHSKPTPEKNALTLPFPGKVAQYKTRKNGEVINPARHAQALLDGAMRIADLRNPMVERALYQVRRVVNAIMQKYGKPDVIRVEMARELKANSKQRADNDKRNKDNEKRNQEAVTALEQSGIVSPSRNDVLKYKLWQECHHACPYTGKAIGWHALFGDYPQFDIEHIIPYQRCLDDSYMNKTLCERDENARKGALTPAELYAADTKKYTEVLTRAKRLPYPKFKRFTLDALSDMDDFVSQQLNETRYIARQTVTFLAQLGVSVQPVKGGTTALLRRAWGLNGILGSDGEKTRLDHRHHAIDALVVALTDRAAVQKLSRYHAKSDRGLRIEGYPEPIDNLRRCASEAVDNIIIAHKTNRKIQGALHKEFLYGITGNIDEKGMPEVVIRKPLQSLGNGKDLQHIRDPKIRQMALVHLSAAKNFKAAFANPENPFGYKDQHGRLLRAIYKARMVYNRTTTAIGAPNDSNRPVRNVWTQSNHHIEIVRITDSRGREKWQGNVVTMLEATRRKRHGLPVVQSRRADNAQFVMAIHKEDMFRLHHKGQDIICRVQKFDQSGLIALRLHTDASQDLTTFIYKTPETLRQSNAQKIIVSPIGEIQKAHD